MYLVRSTFCLKIRKTVLVFAYYDRFTIFNFDDIGLVSAEFLLIKRPFSDNDCDFGSLLLFHIFFFKRYSVNVISANLKN